MMQLPRYIKPWLGRGIVCLSLGLMVSWQVMAKPVGRFDHAKAQYEETSTDLVVKVLGGEIKIKRRYRDGEWLFNPQWVTLQLNRVTPDGTPSNDTRYPVSAINRDLYIYEKSRVLQAGENIVARFVYEHDPSKHILQTRTGFIWEDRGGDQIHYDFEGKIVRYQDKNGVTVSFNRDSEGNMTGILDHHGAQVVTLNYSQGNLVAVRDYSGRQVSYQWDNTALVQATDVNGHEWRYEYQTLLNKPYMHKAIDPEGQEVIFTNRISRSGVVNISSQPFSGSSVGGVVAYGGGTGQISGGISDNSASFGQRSINAKPMVVLTKKSYGDGAYIRYQAFYNAQDERYTTVEKTSDGSEILRTYAKDGSVGEVSIGGKHLFTQVKSGNRRVVQDGIGNRVEIVYDQWENPLSIRHPDGASESYVYHAKFNAPTEYIDQRGYRVEYRYDDFGNLLEKIEAVDTPEQRTQKYRYDQFGQLLSLMTFGRDESDSIEVSFNYDQYGNIVKFVDGKGIDWDLEQFTAVGKPRKVTDGRSNSWLYSYDNTGNLSRVMSPESAKEESSWSLVYKKNGDLYSISDPLNQLKIFEYNLQGHLKSEKDSIGIVYSRNYLIDGRIKSHMDGEGNEYTLNYDRQNRIKSLIDPEGNVTELGYYKEDNSALAWVNKVTRPEISLLYEFNSIGQPISALVKNNKDNSVKKTGFNYNRSKYPEVVKDALGNTTYGSYDAFNRLTEKKDALGGVSKIEYNFMGLVSSVTDAKKRTTSYDYDHQGNRTKITLPDGNAFHFEYDNNRNLVRKILPTGSAIIYKYDFDNRVIKEEHYPEINNVAIVNEPEKVIEYQYYLDGRLKLAKISSLESYHQVNYQYDERGQIVQEDFDYSLFNKAIRYSYYKNGLLKSVDVSKENEVQYLYDQSGRLSVAKFKEHGSVVYSSYTGLLPTEIKYPGGIKRTNSYDGFGKLSKIRLQDKDDNIIETIEYAYNDIGSLIEKKNQLGVYSYQYDKLDRLVRANQPTPLENREFEYDAVGNRTKSTEESNWHYGDNHQLLQKGSAFFSYDSNGNLISEHVGSLEASPDREYKYSAEGRLLGFVNNDELQATYDYDYKGRRIYKKSSDGTKYYLYSQQGLVGEYDPSGNMISGYQYSPEARWGQSPWLRVTADEVGFYQNDNLGTPIMMLKSNGQKLWRGVYDAFGEVKGLDGKEPSSLRFPGQKLDRTSGLHYNYHRDYEPSIGRYIQRDPIGLLGGMNSYTYALTNPLKYIDMYGLASFCESLRIIIANGPNQFTDGSDLYTSEITQEIDLLLRLGLDITTSENIDLQYFLLQHNYVESADRFSGVLSVLFVQTYIYIGSAVSAYNRNTGVEGFLMDVSADTHGNTAGYTSGLMGIEEYYESVCEPDC